MKKTGEKFHTIFAYHKSNYITLLIEHNNAVLYYRYIEWLYILLNTRLGDHILYE